MARATRPAPSAPGAEGEAARALVAAVRPFLAERREELSPLSVREASKHL